ncbi:MAG: cytochrome P450, partial [Pseudomonadota bacterium]
VKLKLPIIGRMTFATTHGAVTDLLKDTEQFCTDPKNAGRSAAVGLQWWMPKSFRLLAKNLLSTDDPEHRRQRGLVDQAFHARSVASMEAQIRDRVEEQISQLLDDPEHDLVQHLSRPLPLRIICDLLGLPERDHGRFMEWMEPVSQFGGVLQLWRMMASMGKLTTYLRDTFAERRAHPQDDMISDLVNGHYEGARLTDDELLSLVFILFVAGHETTTHLISNAVVTLLRHPDQREKYQSDPAGLGAAMIDEVLRFDCPVQLSKPRMARYDLEFHGHRLKKGTAVMSMLHSANWDPTVFQN